jgi:hypothetical protein
MEGTKTMALETTFALANGRANGHRGNLGPQNSNVVLLDQHGKIPTPWVQSSPTGPIAEVVVRDHCAKGTNSNTEETDTPVRQATGSGNTELVPKPSSRRSKIKYVPQAQLDAELAKLEQLSQSALAGDTAALDQLRVELDNCPHVWRRLTDLQQLVEHKLIELVAGIDPLRVEAFRKRCSELRHELLEGEVSSLLVKMAASRALACWMFCQFLELRALEDPQDLRCIKQLEQSERRYQVAMRTFQMARHADLQLQRLTQQAS